MKLYFLLFAFFSVLIVRGQNKYYISSSGDDANNSGTSPTSPWQSIAKVNSMMISFNAGDSILFNRGDEFRGELIISRSGTSGNSINFGSYGVGSKPVINGAQSVTNWQVHATNIWVADYTGPLTTLNNFFVNEVSQQIGRFPNLSASNSGYNSIDSFVGNSQLTDAPLNGLDFSGGTAVVRVRLFILNKPLITSHSASTLTFAPNGTNYDMTAGDGYFIQNHVNTLDQQGEWCFDAAAKKIYFYSTIDPTALKIEVPVYNNTLSANNISNVNISDLKFINGNIYGVRIENSNGIKVQNCDFSNSHNAIFLSVVQHAEVTHNTIDNTNNNAIWIAGTFYNCNYNSISNTALRPGMGEPNNNQYNAINMTGTDATVMGNRITKVGYCGIRFEGSRLTVKNNVIDEFALTKSDIGAIYSFKGFAPATYGYGNNLITGNIIRNGVPNLFGTRAIPVNTNYAVGIYLDQSTVNNTVTNNTVYKCNSAGFMINEGANNHTVRNNVFYNNLFGFALFPTVTTSKNLTIKNNIWFSKHPSQIPGMSQATNLDYMKNFGVIDSNYFAQPFEPDSGLIQTNENYSTRINKVYSLNDWKKLGYEINSSLSDYKVAPYVLTAAGTNTITNGTFNSNISSWTLTPTSGTLAPVWDNTNTLDGGSLRLSTLSATEPATSRAAAVVGNLQFGKFYQVSFSMKGSTDTARLKVVLFGGNPVAKYRYVQTSTQRKEVTMVFTPVASINNVLLQLTLNDAGNQVWLDNVQFKPLTTTNTNPDDYLYFAVNDEAAPKSFNVGSAVYKDVKGNIYSGSFTLPAYSSNVLMKTGGVLPLKLSSFYGYAETCNANLQWTAEDERGLRAFEIESRTQDEKIFKKLASVAPTAGGSYKQVLNQPAQEAYYRLKIINQDGSIEYSNVITVSTLCKQQETALYPNPVKTSSLLNYHAASNTKIVTRIHNSNGQLVSTRDYAVVKGSNSLTIEASNLATGYYILSVIEPGAGVIKIPFIKQ